MYQREDMQIFSHFLSRVRQVLELVTENTETPPFQFIWRISTDGHEKSGLGDAKHCDGKQAIRIE